MKLSVSHFHEPTEVESTDPLVKLEFFRIAKSTGYKSSELESLQEGNTLCIGGKEIEVRSNFYLWPL